MCKPGTFLENFCKVSHKECHVRSFEKNHKAMPTTLKAHSVQCSFVFQVLIYENVTYLIYFWKQNFISLNLPLLKVMGSKERLVMSGVKMFLLFMIKAVAWEEGANQRHCSPGHSFLNTKTNVKKSFVSGESHSSYLLETVFFYLFFKTEFLPASFSAPQHKPVSVASYPQIAHQSQK